MIPCSTVPCRVFRLGTRWFGLTGHFWSAVLVFALMLVAGFVLEPRAVRFEFMGVDWDKVPWGYHGVVPEKPYMDLEIPREYLNTTVVPFLFLQSIGRNIGFYGPSTKRRSSILIDVYYPSMWCCSPRLFG